MNLPFTRSEFMDVFADYNTALGPAVLMLWLTTVSVVGLGWFRPSLRSPRLTAGLLAILWAWSAIVYFALFFRRINPAAPLFAGLFLVVSILFLRMAVWGQGLELGRRGALPAAAGAILVVYALAYPFLNLLFGMDYPRMATFGLPCPTVTLTAGLLVAADSRISFGLILIPLIWTVVGGSAAFLLGVHADLVLPVAGVLLVITNVSFRSHPLRTAGT